ncbi:SMI1/KNR4 family protein [Bremerella sp.]|uniref:SMI1/KNR4 family protein n=1 Tax=Bremerella sp. TaxID=2795602 RepID=UPI00391AD9BC
MDLHDAAGKLGGIMGVGGGPLAPMTATEIYQLEQELGCRFPETYRKFLETFGASRFNGESPDNPYVVFRSLTPMPSQFEGNLGMLDALYGGQTDDSDPYSIRVRARYFADRIPGYLIPIGDAGGTGQICLGISGEHAGKVYYWDQLNESQADESDIEARTQSRSIFANINQIAESFADFLDRLEFMKE